MLFKRLVNDIDMTIAERITFWYRTDTEEVEVIYVDLIDGSFIAPVHDGDIDTVKRIFRKDILKSLKHATARYEMKDKAISPDCIVVIGDVPDTDDVYEGADWGVSDFIMMELGAEEGHSVYNNNSGNKIRYDWLPFNKL